MGKRTGKPRGRPRGTTHADQFEKQVAVQKVITIVEEVIPNAFEGDAHAFLCTVYKNPEVAMPIRIVAASKAIGYEKPALAAMTLPSPDDVQQQLTLEGGRTIDHDHLENLTQRYAKGLKVINGGK